MENPELIHMLSLLLDEKIQPLNNRLDRLEEGQQASMERFQKLEEGQQALTERFDGLEVRLQNISDKLEYVSKQVAINTEKLTIFESVAVKVAENDTDIKLLKKIIIN